jgi:hypothetical protein
MYVYCVCMCVRHLSCDIRIQLPHVSKQHAKIEVDENQQIVLENLSASGSTLLNSKAISVHSVLQHGDVFVIGDRGFRMEYMQQQTQKCAENKINTATIAPIACTTPLKPSQQPNLPAPAVATPKTKSSRRSSVAKTPVAAAPADNATVASTPSKTIAAVSVPIPSPVPAATAAVAVTLPAVADAKINFEASLATLTAPLESVAEGEETQFLSPKQQPAAVHATPLALNKSVKKTLPTPLRHNIHSLSQSEQIPAIVLKPKLAGLAKLSTPLKKGIATGRLTLKTAPIGAVEQKISAPALEQEAVSAEEIAMPISHSLPTPIRQGTQSRRTSSRRSSLAHIPIVPMGEINGSVESNAVHAEGIVDIETRVEVAPIEAGVVASPVPQRHASRHVLPTPVRAGIAERAAAAQPKPKLLSMPTPMKKSIRAGRANLKSVPAVTADIAMEIEANAEVEEEAVAVAQREATVHLSSELLHEAAATLEPAIEEEEEVEAEPQIHREVTMHLSRDAIAEVASSLPARRRAIATPLKAGIVSKAAALAGQTRPISLAPKVLNTPLKQAIRKVAPKQMPVMLSMSTPLKKELRGGRANLKPVEVFESLLIEVGESALPIDASVAQLVAVESAHNSVPARRASIRHAASSVDATFAAVVIPSPLKQSLSVAAAAVANQRANKQTKKVLATPLRKGIRARPALAHVEPVSRPIIAAEEEEQIEVPAGSRALPNPVRQSIQALRRRSTRRSSVVPFAMAAVEEEASFALEQSAEAEEAIVAEEQTAVDEETPVEVEVAVEEEIEAIASPIPQRRASRRVLPTPVRAAIAAKAGSVQPKPKLLAMSTPMKKSIRTGRANLKSAPAPIPAPVETEEVDVAMEHVDTKNVDQSADESGEAEVQIEVDEVVVEQDDEDDIAIIQREPTMRLSIGFTREEEEPIPAKERPHSRRAMATPIKAAIVAKAELVAAQANPAPVKVLSTPLKQAIRKVAPKQMPVMLSMSTPLKKELRGGRAQLKSVPIAVPVEEEESNSDSVDVEAAEPASVGAEVEIDAVEAESVPEDEQKVVSEIVPVAPVTAVIASAAAAAAAPLLRKPIRLMPVDRRLAKRRQGAHQRIVKTISGKSSTAVTAAQQKARITAAARAKVLASLPRNIVAAADISTTILTGLDELLNGSNSQQSAPLAEDEPVRALIEPIFAALTSLKHDAMMAAAGIPSPIHVARGCHSSVPTPTTPGRRASMTPSARRRWSFLSTPGSVTKHGIAPPSGLKSSPLPRMEFENQLATALAPPTPFSPAAAQAQASLVSNLVSLLSPSPARGNNSVIRRSARDSIDSIFAGLVGIEMSLDQASDEDMDAEDARALSLSFLSARDEEEEECKHDEIVTPMKRSNMATPMKESPVMLAFAHASPSPRRALSTPLRASIVAKASGFVRNVVAKQTSMATPLRKAILAKQAELAAAAEVKVQPVKVLATPLRKAIRGGRAGLKPVPQPTPATIAEESVGLSVFDGLEALEEAMFTAAALEPATVEPVSFSLHAAASPSPAKKAASRRASRRSMSVLPTSIAEELAIEAPTATIVTEDALINTVELTPAEEAEQVAEHKHTIGAVSLLEEAIMNSIEQMVTAQVVVEQAIAAAVEEAEAAILAQNYIEAEADVPVEQVAEESVPIKVTKGKKAAAPKAAKRGRKAAAVPEEEQTTVAAEEEVIVPSPKKQRVTEPQSIVAAPVNVEEIPAAAPSKTNKRARTRAVVPAAAIEQPIVVLTAPMTASESDIEEAVVAPAPKGRLAAASKRKAAVAEVEMEVAPVVTAAAVDVVVEVAAPVKITRGGRGKKVVAATVEEPASVIVIAEPEPAVVEVVSAPAPKRGGRGKKAAAAVAVPESVPLVEEIAVEQMAPAAAAPVRVSRKRKGADAIVEEVVPVVDAPLVEPVAPVVESVLEAPIPKRARGGRKAAATAVVPEASIVVDAPVPVIVSKVEEIVAPVVVKASRGRKGKATIAVPMIDEVAVEPIIAPAVDVEIESAPKKVTRGRKAATVPVQSEQVEVEEPAPARSTRTTRTRK